MIHDSVLGVIGRTPLVRLGRLFPDGSPEVIAKLEYLNPSGSMKDRAAQYIVAEGVREGRITPLTHLVESSSGNFGIAMATVARIYGLRFTCVVDPKTTSANWQLLRCLDANVEVVTKPDEQGGYLKSRLARVRELLEEIPSAFWVNQYGNELNWRAHYDGTGKEILDDLDGPVDCVAVPVSTTGTIMGVGRRLREAFPDVAVVAVDMVGSVIFGAEGGPRELPGIGSSIVPDILDPTEIDEVVYVSAHEAAVACRELCTLEAIVAGGSSGAVVAGIRKLECDLTGPCRIVTVLPDRGERYLDTVYDDEWLESVRRSYSHAAAEVV
jgi:cysteine synthase A